jgi:hypothetical protein
MKIGPLDVWSAYREQLYKLGVAVEPPLPPSPGYCNADERDLH